MRQGCPAEPQDQPQSDTQTGLETKSVQNRIQVCGPRAAIGESRAIREEAGWWNVSMEMRAKAEPITSQTAALTNIKNNGSRHEASISESAIGVSSPG